MIAASETETFRFYLKCIIGVICQLWSNCLTDISDVRNVLTSALLVILAEMWLNDQETVVHFCLCRLNVKALLIFLLSNLGKSTM